MKFNASGRFKVTASTMRTVGVIGFLALLAGTGGAQRGGPATSRAAAPIDLTGDWVSVVTEDWRWRMVIPPRGDYTGVPLNSEGQRVADAWDPADARIDGCRAYGAPAVMRRPGRLHISWEDAETLQIETDAGLQTRRLHFDRDRVPEGEPSWQGHAVAEWQLSGGRGQPRAGSLSVTTDHLRAGYLRTNGVPYSADTVVTEYFDRLNSGGIELLTVVTIVEDPRYLTQPFITSTHFRREADRSGWLPTPCE